MLRILTRTIEINLFQKLLCNFLKDVIICSIVDLKNKKNEFPLSGALHHIFRGFAREYI